MSQSLLDDVIARIARLPDTQRDRVIQDALEATKNMVWVPNPGPQTMAYNSLADELYYGGQAGGGKDLALDTPIPTTTGWTTMGELSVGSCVLSDAGEPCKVTAISEIFHHQCYRITFVAGSQIVCGGGHQWATTTAGERLDNGNLNIESIRTTEEIWRTLDLMHAVRAAGAARKVLGHLWYFTNIEPCETVPTRCIQVESPSRMYLCSRAMIPTHNSDLGIGAALTKHEQSLILRRFTADADSLAERTVQILGSRDGFNGSPPVTIRLPGRMLTYGGMKDREDRQRYKGDPKDLMVWDEIPDFLEDQYTFVIGWNRSANPAQRSRVICTGNPPTQPEGLWVIKRWAAWLDPSHPKYGKVKDGDLLWYTTIDGKDTEVDGPGPHWIGGESIIAKSRTFIRAKLSDNPDLSATNYDAVLAAMPERERLAYREGRFDASLKDKTFQICPSAWVRAAQDRWTDRPPMGVPMCAMFVDCTGGGNDPMAIASRHDGWYAPIHITPGHEIPSEFAGRFAAGIVVSQRRDNALMIIDMGGGYGGPLYEHLHMNFDGSNQDREPIVKPYKGSEASVRRTSDGTVGFSNKRTETLWKFREALDPGQAGGSPIMLAADDELFADLTAPSYKLERGLYHAEPKDKVCARLGRSTNKGDAVTGAWTAGPIASTDGAIWDQMRKEMGKSGRMGGRRPQVIMGRHNAKR